MDPLDIKATSPVHDPWDEFLGLGNKKQKATAQNSYEADLQNRFPFSDNCAQQKELVKAMYAESAQTLSARNSAKKNSKQRNDLTGKLRAFDAYIPMAVDYMNNTSCAIVSGGSTGGGVKTTTTTGAGGTGTTTSSPMMKYILIGSVAAIVIGGSLYLYKRSKS